MYKQVVWRAKVNALKPGEGELPIWRQLMSGCLRKLARCVEGRNGEEWVERHYLVKTFPALTLEEVDECLARSTSHAESLMSNIAQSKAIDVTTEDFFRWKDARTSSDG
ncbi:hypothetical protein ACTXK7_07180 [Vreelandella alkaliphila]|uniref:hypothetical protein n=1 Tax=Halomonadaceae TaxID=28256 RepID=UPI003F8F8C77